MDFTGERFVPEVDDRELEIEHMQRYLSVLDVTAGKIVLDAACGEGYGSNLIAEWAERVYGVDISEEAIRHASEQYKRPNLTFIKGSVASLPLPDRSVEVVISFETIEHIGEELQKAFLDEIKRVLVPDGILIISTPDKRIYTDESGQMNPFHVREFYRSEFGSFLGQEFANVMIFTQNFEVMSVIGKDDSERYLAIRRPGNGAAADSGKYMIAVCSNGEGELPDISAASIVEEGRYASVMRRIISLQDEVEERNRHIARLDGEIARLDEQIAGQETKLWELEALRQRAEALQAENSRLQERMRNQQGHIEQLLEQERRLDAILRSGGWKALLRYYQLRDRVIPPNSRRKLIMKLGKMTLTNPRKMLGHLNKQNLAKFKYYLKADQPGMLENRIDNYTGRYDTPSSSSVLQLISMDEPKEKLVFPRFDRPRVSIIIPVYNQWDYTYACLDSILQHTEGIAYEVIVADDMSSDETVHISRYAENITVVRDGTNRGFLLNCNHAAGSARGDYLYFLNNDTNVQPDWLSSLTDLMDRDSSIGMAGSRLVYPDGRQQEAAGIIWNDASGWNYGRLDDPGKPEYNYVKEADYISGAAIMIRRELWNEIGGFDERYVPAYNEDSDLAFEVRSRGYKVVYQPASVVVHFEGISHGTDTGSGIKSYQLENKVKFFEKWKSVLEREHFPNAEHVFLARDRSKGRKTVLVVDHYVPHFDKDAGSRTMYQYLRLFVELGYNVKFVGDNFYNHEPYTTALQQMGIEVLYGEWYSRNFRDWLQRNGEYIDIVMLNRPHISIKYIDPVRRYTKAKIIYYGHDLHYLREMRGYELSGNPALLESADKWREMEHRLIRAADVAYYPSEVEVREIKKELPDAAVKAIPAYIYEGEPQLPHEIEGSNHLLFVGGFGHKPNTDAVIWFVQNIFPIIQKRVPGVKFIVVGSNPPDEVKALASPDVVVTGFVTDDELSQYYRQSRVVIVPLRFGAGVKGKVVEAMYYRCPIVTTSVGAEGLRDIEHYVEIADGVADFADKTVALYSNEDKLRKLSAGSGDYIRQYFSKESVLATISTDFT